MKVPLYIKLPFPESQIVYYTVEGRNLYVYTTDKRVYLYRNYFDFEMGRFSGVRKEVGPDEQEIYIKPMRIPRLGYVKYEYPLLTYGELFYVSQGKLVTKTHRSYILYFNIELPDGKYRTKFIKYPKNGNFYKLSKDIFMGDLLEDERLYNLLSLDPEWFLKKGEKVIKTSIGTFIVFNDHIILKRGDIK